MEVPNLADDSIRPEDKRTKHRWLRPIAWGLLLSGLIYTLVFGAIWYHAIGSSLTVRWIRIHVYEELLALYVLVVAVLPIGLIASTATGLVARRNRNRRLATRAGRALLTCLGLLVGICLCEVVCAWKLRRLALLVHPSILNTQMEEPKPDSRPLQWMPETRSSAGTFEVVTIGGSSAEGVPFFPHLSLDRIVTWQLGRVFPGRTFHNNNRAIQGIHLERAIEQLAGLTRRPDLLIVYSGHNEFQSRFGWSRKVPYYWVESKLGRKPMPGYVRSWSSTAEFLGRNADRFAIELAPPPRYERDPADSPSCTAAEYAATLEDFRRRLDGLLDDCDTAGVMTVIVVPPSNDAFDPNRSILSPDISLAGQRDFMARLQAIRRIESDNPGRAMESYRELIAEQPGFAETHYRLAQLLEAAGSFEEARKEYIAARDLDGSPFRCQTPFLEVCRELGRRHGSIVIDAPRLLESASPHGIVDDRFFGDAHHPGLNAFVIMARDIIRQLKDRGAFGWRAEVPVPQFSMADCVEHFHLDQSAWIEVIRNSWKFYVATTPLPRDPSWRMSVAERCGEAIEVIQAGKGPDDTGIPSLKLREELYASISPAPNS